MKLMVIAAAQSSSGEEVTTLGEDVSLDIGGLVRTPPWFGR